MDRAVLLALTHDPQSVSAIAARAKMPESEVRAGLQRLTEQSLAIPEDDGYELTGPLSWFGSFGAAVRYYARRNFLVNVPGEPESHLLLCDIRIKDGTPAGAPSNTTAGVFACGRTARELLQAAGAAATCKECRRATEGA
jgi:hypothetical protein